MLGVNIFTNNQATPTTIAAEADVANPAGGSSGASVTVAITIDEQFGTGRLPSTYAVVVTPSQSCFASVTNKTNTGFNVVLTPTSGSVTLAAGTFDVVVIG